MLTAAYPTPARTPTPLDKIDEPVSTLALVNSTDGPAMDRTELPNHAFPILVGELEIPATFVPKVDELRKRARSQNRRELARFEEAVRLRIYFGGMHVACVKTKDGTKVIAAGYPGTGVLRAELRRFDGDGEREITIEAPRPWKELADSNAGRDG